MPTVLIVDDEQHIRLLIEPRITRASSTGLGLPNCREIVERHGGRLWLGSELGRGSMFAFGLPVAAA